MTQFNQPRQSPSTVRIPVRASFPFGVYCLWEWKGDAFATTDRWHLADSFEFDNQGRLIDRPAPTQDEFLYHDGPFKQRPIPGRCVTAWTWTRGVFLVDINPPGGFPDWLSSTFLTMLKQGDEWIRAVLGGMWIQLETAEVARHVIEGRVWVEESKTPGG